MPTKQFTVTTVTRSLLADDVTPMTVYQALRPHWPELLFWEYEESGVPWSIIAAEPLASIEISDPKHAHIAWPGGKQQDVTLKKPHEGLQLLETFRSKFCGDNNTSPAQQLIGYSSYDAVQMFEDINFDRPNEAPLARYRLYRYVIAVNRRTNELRIAENYISGISQPATGLPKLEYLIRQTHAAAPAPFAITGAERSNMTDSEFLKIVDHGQAHTRRGDVFQIVLSRRFEQELTGDPLTLFRAQRSLNPSPYMYYFAYEDFVIAGTSPESHLIVRDSTAIIHPIAGSRRRGATADKDAAMAEELLADAKENAEHVMLVDLARNDLSRHCREVTVTAYKELHRYSHIMHIVSTVSGRVKTDPKPFELIADTFPAGTLSGAPKYKAMELINKYEPTTRGYYGGAIGTVNFTGDCNHAIMIRTFFIRDNTLVLQAGAGIVALSKPEDELLEVHNKLGALRAAMTFASTLSQPVKEVVA